MPTEKHTDLLRLSAEFPSISLGEMDSIRLMNRTDTKYLTDSETLLEVLRDAVQAGYRIFENGDRRLLTYDSIYFDTPSLWMFTEHRRGKAVRFKVRKRLYTDSGECFLEVKRKNNHSRTKKKRTSIGAEDFRGARIEGEALEWITGVYPFPASALSPSVETIFKRITLVDPALTERTTIDFDVRFRNLRNGAEAELGGMRPDECASEMSPSGALKQREAVIIELKRDGRLHSPLQDILLRCRVKPLRVSKYCIGVVSTDPSVHPGRFKEKMRAISKIASSSEPLSGVTELPPQKEEYR